MRLIFGVCLLLFLLGSDAPAEALCDGVTDDSATIQAGFPGNVKLPVGRCLIGTPLILSQGSTLEGSGVDATILLGITPDMDLLIITGTSRVAHLNLGQSGLPWPVRLHRGLTITGPIDRILIDDIYVSGHFTDSAFRCDGGAASSTIRASRFWTWGEAAVTGYFLQCADWVIEGSEFHNVGAPSPSDALLLWQASSLRFYGGNIAGDDLLVNNSQSAWIIFDGTAFYSDAGLLPRCAVGLFDSPMPAFRANPVPPGTPLTC